MRNITRLGAALVGATLCLSSQALSVHAQSGPGDAALVGELVAFHGSKTIVSVMTTHCYETTGLDPAYKQAAEDWYLRNIGFLDLADRVVARLGGAAPQEQQAVETYAGEQIMSAYNQTADKNAFCREFLAKVEAGGFDIDKQLPGPLKQAQEIASQ
ncbi:hypothetical protein [Devosia nitrariae]|uniref:Uncharacterized protein n=1 Tax=Devosia nitrariae TaxID=2071872 RepID=A0ABQ5W3T6_9HYPH|nr:hypothetical protein [Devosia nitrariae]GLQ54346.1 hypothetical protein GCM10010862_16050 [Devosia nitrariae]